MRKRREDGKYILIPSQKIERKPGINHDGRNPLALHRRGFAKTPVDTYTAFALGGRQVKIRVGEKGRTPIPRRGGELLHAALRAIKSAICAADHEQILTGTTSVTTQYFENPVAGCERISGRRIKNSILSLPSSRMRLAAAEWTLRAEGERIPCFCWVDSVYVIQRVMRSNKTTASAGKVKLAKHDFPGLPTRLRFAVSPFDFDKTDGASPNGGTCGQQMRKAAPSRQCMSLRAKRKRHMLVY